MSNLSEVRGANYVPSYACNNIVLWRDFDADVIDTELGYAEKLNLNSIRVFLQYVVYESDPGAFLERFDKLLELCGKHGLTLMPVLFDSCGVEPQLDMHAPDEKGGWQSSPGPSREAVANWPDLGRYLHDIVEPYKNDARVILWDCFNEPTFNQPVTQALVHHTITEVKAMGPSQPVSSGWGVGDAFGDVTLIHPYFKDMVDLERLVEAARQVRPEVLITEMAGRPNNGLFQDLIPKCEELGVGWYFWELMLGATQFRKQWGGKDVPGHEGVPFQGVLHPDGTPYDPEEARFIDGTWKDA